MTTTDMIMITDMVTTRFDTSCVLCVSGKDHDDSC
eukprot:CAMPEP_0203637028 /NCGR_PEP_ID=MMETSP0088-20131115/3441_1 /ASSEMBLY_ACC=CAM_ASM_001087 /TAXON_ID=426623 /ORGANISM="Chaetoceros affinis, Strain CCMP159" /LENGTH=34 /DNA_ID= /DNA_START= /DNA_END= /DNA_ORIENTATION=